MAKFLLIDDNTELLEVQGEYLEAHGHAVTTAINGCDALACLSRETFDVMVTDVIMPEMDGFETIMEVKKKYPALPVIAISGGGRIGALDYLTMAKRMGANATLAKPVAPSVLMAEAEYLLAGTGESEQRL